MKCIGALVMIFMALGCGSSAPKKPEAKPVEPKKSEPRAVATGPIEMIGKDERQQTIWTLKGDQAKVISDETNSLSGSFTNVTGTLMKEGKVASQIRAGAASADNKNEKLELTHGVRITSLTEKAIVHADRVHWIRDKRILEATGNVRVNAPGYENGTFDRIWANADLTEIGTPDLFEKFATKTAKRPVLKPGETEPKP